MHIICMCAEDVWKDPWKILISSVDINFLSLFIQSLQCMTRNVNNRRFQQIIHSIR